VQGRQKYFPQIILFVFVFVFFFFCPSNVDCPDANNFRLYNTPTNGRNEITKLHWQNNNSQRLGFLNIGIVFVSRNVHAFLIFLYFIFTLVRVCKWSTHVPKERFPFHFAVLFTYFGIILGLSHYERIYDTVPLPSLLKQSSLLLRAIEKKNSKA
jgi:hypothetical protein